MHVTVVGTGYVGLVTGVGLAKMGHNVICMDIDHKKITALRQGQIPIYEPGLQELMIECLERGTLQFTSDPSYAYQYANLIFLAVGTPQHPDGTANLSYIESACDTIAAHLTESALIVTKSTVPVGTNERLRARMAKRLPTGIEVEFASNPEFLREGSGIHDFFHGDRIVIGTENEKARLWLQELYEPLEIPMFFTDVRSSEMIKYASNAFLATKISFINEIANICQKTGADVEAVARGMGMDMRIGSQFLKAGVGYGGSCFPKDTNALVQIAGDVKHDFRLLKAVIEVNNQQQEVLVEMAENVMMLTGKKVALLGLSFKPNTDDIREAPSIVIAKRLLAAGAIVRAYDPQAMGNMKRVLPDLLYTSAAEEALQDADAAFLVTEWKEIIHIPLKRYVELMKTPRIFDGRNVYSLQEALEAGVEYYSIGRKAIGNETLTTQ
ncbi:UDP-glucose/GDP-mannose dehydrogenase family protein [Ectobacillus antri]|uniref:UDP-glucose 6-dehydrogenase n=1 Tax=Ectobacillus antri TaxID=2486280 RepID=A0ABT6H811_9BACI|nr:UDP-glucose/GDP-mannose dehydrogenase family protein [Ectobacillus antri]MDG4657187.1 UDP-glucose/GDP-mannose dehydrogenase family protein [Ectobacillus antri]MDG5755200.1 UDP-glucose/GDP-mannose dehydrogenase family protein [Ectobacillus antri]